MTESRNEQYPDPVLGAPLRYTSREVADSVGVPMHHARRFWRALGFANVDASEVAFTDSDVNALRILTGLISDGTIDEPQVVHFTRLLGRATSRLAGSHVELLNEQSGPSGDTASDDRGVGRIPYCASRMTSDVEWLLGYSWRRHIRAALDRFAACSDGTAQTTLGVGFADMVGYTELSNRASDAQLTHIIERFEGRTADIVAARGGRVMKLLGDEILFNTADASTLADIATQLVDTFRTDPDIPAVRIGLAYGTVVQHLGDIYGTTVNLASRLTALAEPSTVLTAPALATRLVIHPGYRLHPLGTRHLRGIGPTSVIRLARERASR